MFGSWSTYNFGVWRIVNISNNEIMGHCGFRHIDNTEDIEIIYLLDTKYWGQGFATEVGRAVIQYAFTILNLDKVTARVRINNRSQRMLLTSSDLNLLAKKDIMEECCHITN